MSTAHEPHDLTPTTRPDARVQRTPIVFGVIAILVAAFATTTEITGRSLDLSAAQWMFGIGAVLMAIGLVGFVLSRRR
ncbi:MAG: hypothetical protein Q4G43_11575 [Mobilicoccus sp.]|nr:hypothetical protein [Mobilicoccus sp.]